MSLGACASGRDRTAAIAAGVADAVPQWLGGIAARRYRHGLERQNTRLGKPSARRRRQGRRLVRNPRGGRWAVLPAGFSFHVFLGLPDQPPPQAAPEENLPTLGSVFGFPHTGSLKDYPDGFYIQNINFVADDRRRKVGRHGQSPIVTSKIAQARSRSTRGKGEDFADCGGEKVSSSASCCVMRPGADRRGGGLKLDLSGIAT